MTSIFAVSAAVVLACPDASATYSILLHDRVTAEYGGAAISCVGDFDLTLIFGVVPRSPTGATGFAFFAQALYSEENHAHILHWGATGLEPRQILDTLTQSNFDPLAAERQYHFLSSGGASLMWTGSATLPYSGSLAGSVEGWSFTAAGNILSSERVLSQIADALAQSTGTMAERLLIALRAGAENGEGDSRCGTLPGDSAFVTVISETGTPRLALRVVDSQPENPLTLLGAALAQRIPESPSPEPSKPAPAPPNTVQRNAMSCSASSPSLPNSASEPFCLLPLLLMRRRTSRWGRERGGEPDVAQTQQLTRHCGLGAINRSVARRSEHRAPIDCARACAAR